MPRSLRKLGHCLPGVAWKGSRANGPLPTGWKRPRDEGPIEKLGYRPHPLSTRHARKNG